MKHLVNYQRELVDKGKLTAVASFENLARARNVSFSKLVTAVNLSLSTSR